MIDALDSKNLKTFETSDGYADPIEPVPVNFIVDDDDDSRLMLRFLLESWKYQVIETKTGIEAISLAEKACPDLIIMDVKMPDLDGFSVTRHLRQSVKTEKLPVIFLSGCAEISYKQQAAAVGGNEYLVKPVDFQQLEFILGKYASNSQIF